MLNNFVKRSALKPSQYRIVKRVLSVLRSHINWSCISTWTQTLTTVFPDNRQSYSNRLDVIKLTKLRINLRKGDKLLFLKLLQSIWTAKASIFFLWVGYHLFESLRDMAIVVIWLMLAIWLFIKCFLFHFRWTFKYETESFTNKPEDGDQTNGPADDEAGHEAVHREQSNLGADDRMNVRYAVT